MRYPFIPAPPVELAEQDLEAVASGKDDNVRLGFNNRGQPYSDFAKPERSGRRS